MSPAQKCRANHPLVRTIRCFGFAVKYLQPDIHYTANQSRHRSLEHLLLVLAYEKNMSSLWHHQMLWKRGFDQTQARKFFLH